PLNFSESRALREFRLERGAEYARSLPGYVGAVLPCACNRRYRQQVYPRSLQHPVSSIMTRSSSATRRTLILAGLALSAVLALPMQYAAAATSAGAETVRAFYST